MLLVMAMAASIAGGVHPHFSETGGSLPQTPAPSVVTLQDAIGRARMRSPLVEGARERERAASLARAVVPRTPNPLFELRGENFGPVSTTRLPRDVFATVSQPIELGGKRGARLADAAAAGSLASVDVATAEWAVTADVVETYIDALRARDVMATLLEQRQGVGELVDILAQRVREGLSAEADLRKFETEHTRLASQATRASIALQSALVLLSATVGDELRSEQLVAPRVPESALTRVALVEADILNRADVRTAVARLERAETLAALERARGVPDVTVTAGYKRTSGFDTAVAAVTVPIAFFDRNRVAIAHAAGDVSAARLDLQRVRQRALADAQVRWAAARDLSAQAARIEGDLVAPAAVVRTAARSAFIEGRGDVLQLVDAERVYGEASREALELRLDATLATIHARLALGETTVP